MSLKGNLPKNGAGSEEASSLIDRLESKIRHLPTSFNEKVINSFNTPSYLANYLHFFDSESRQQQVFIRECLPLQRMYLELHSKLGEETFIGDWFEIDQACIDNFAAVTGDEQWIHTDPERAKQESPFKTNISQGFLTLALIPMLTKSIDPTHSVYPGTRMVVNYGLNKVHFPFPVKVGKRIRARSRVVSLTPMKRGLEVVSEVSVEIENSTRLACVAEPVVRLYF
jgi:acyl dehydratase